MLHTCRRALAALLSALVIHATAQSVGTPVALSEATLAQALLSPGAAPVARGLAVRQNTHATVTLPDVDGVPRDYLLAPSKVLAPALQARYPELRTFDGFRQNQPARRVRATHHPATGWRLSYTGGGEERAVVERDRPAASGTAPPALRYRLVTESDAPSQSPACAIHDDGPAGDVSGARPQSTSRSPASAPAAAPEVVSLASAVTRPRRVYRLALTCNGEYARAVAGATPTTAVVLAEFAQAVNRLNEVFERDLAITLELVDRTDELIYLNPNTDPYVNGDAGAMVGPAHATITEVLGSDGFDVGHLFGTAGEGIAGLGVVCRDGDKGEGVSAIADPRNDRFYIDYVAHELGHQFGATHTFYNSNCGGARAAATGFEPGSGSTIMAYAGICAPNVQNRSDDYFHAASLTQINAFVAEAGCGATVAGENAAPVFAEGAGPYFVPAGSAFELRAAATDPDGDDVSYTFEQMDGGGTAPQPPRGDNAEGPLYRSLPPAPRAYRRFGGTTEAYDVRVTAPRSLNFRITARDLRRPAGQTTARDLRVEIVGGTPLAITSATAADTLAGYGSYRLTWDPGTTAAAPVSAAAVDVYFSPDGGDTWSDTLARGTANDGARDVLVPNVATTRGRFVVRDAAGAFYAVSAADLTVLPATAPTFSLDAAQTRFERCVGAVDLRTDVTVAPLLGFDADVVLSVVAGPGPLTARLEDTGGRGGLSTALRLSGPATAAPYQQAFTLEATGAGQVRRLTVTVEVAAAPAAQVADLGEVDGRDVLSDEVDFAFSAGDATGYRLQIDRAPDFAAPVVDRSFGAFDPELGPGRQRVSGLPAGVYFYRAASVAECGQGPWGAFGSFRVAEVREERFGSPAPVTISDGPGGQYRSTLTVTTSEAPLSVEVDVDVTHSWVGDLSAELLPPDGEALGLWRAPGGGDCGSPNFRVTFADDATRSAADLVNTCDPAPLAVGGRFRAVDALRGDFLDDPRGDWTLVVTDGASEDGGAIEAWNVTLRYPGGATPDVTLSPTTANFDNDVQEVPLDYAALGVRNADDVPLSDLAIVLKPGANVYADPTSGRGGLFDVDGERLPAGTTITFADLAAGQTRLRHSAQSTVGATDTLVFDVIGPDGLYLPNVRVPVRTDAVVGIAESGPRLVLRVYPNPTRDLVRVEVDGASALGEVRLVDVAGRVVRVLAQAAPSATVTADVSDLPAGYYLLDVRTDVGRVGQALIVE